MTAFDAPPTMFVYVEQCSMLYARVVCTFWAFEVFEWCVFHRSVDPCVRVAQGAGLI